MAGLSESVGPHGAFVTTHWSVVRAAGGATSATSAAALEALCGAYWYPLYAYVRRLGYAADDAQDLTQEFFYRLLRSDWIARADSSRGRFRTFLVVGLHNFLANEWQKSRRLKRGQGRAPVPLDALQAEERYRIEPPELASPDKLYERRWALTLLQRALDRLEAEQAADSDCGSPPGDACASEASTRISAKERFSTLRPALLGEPAEDSYAGLARRFGVSNSTVKSWVRRLRHRFREVLREEVACTVSSAEDASEELRHLFRVLAG